MLKYTLMHKNRECGSLLYDENSGRILSYCDFGNGCSPYLGNSDFQKICKWWEMRAIPASRSAMKEIIHKEGFRIDNRIYLAKNLALSLTDTYWIRPKDIPLTFDQLKYHGRNMPYHNAASYDPNASLGGQMDKRGILIMMCLFLLKKVINTSVSNPLMRYLQPDCTNCSRRISRF